MAGSRVDRVTVIADALSRFGQPLGLDLESDNPRAERLKNIYTGTLALAFGMHQWEFLKKTFSCSVVSKATDAIAESDAWLNGYGFAHQLPGDLKKNPEVIFDGSGHIVRDFSIEGRRVYSNCEVIKVTGLATLDPEYWPDDWREAFVTWLAGRFSVPELMDVNLEDKFLTEALGTPRERPSGGMFGRLMAQDLAANPPDSPFLKGDPLSDAHNGIFGNRGRIIW